MKYLIWSYDYRHDSGGPKVLHRLCHELNEAGQEAYVGWLVTNPDWNTPFHDEPLSGDWTAIYPEIVSGNPWNAPHVVRWVLNNPGLLGGDTVYDPSETVFTFSPLFMDAPVLMLPTIELDIYFDRHLPREGAVFYVGKGQRTRDIPGTEITNELKADRELLAETLNRAEVLYSFDIISGMTDIARLCGCPVVLIPDDLRTRGQYDNWFGWDGVGWDEMPEPFDSVAFHSRYAGLYDTFLGQLADFIRATDPVLA